jgi:sugar phosphate isomerase/epimerase
VAGIGIALGFDVRGGAALASLRTRLADVARIGFSNAEISAKALAVIINGQLQPTRLAALKEAVAESPVTLTIHGSAVSTARIGNLVDVTTPAQVAAVEADLALAAAIGAKIVVYHAGQLRDPNGDDRALAAGMAHEREQLRRLGDVAARHGIRIMVENIDPVGIYILRRAYGLRLDLIAEQVQQVNHPNVAMCLDMGHGYLASRYVGWDYLATIRQVAPLVGHIHLNDNFGRTKLDGDWDVNEYLAVGEGDMHLPPGWGAIPLEDVFRTPFPQDPAVILELRPHFAENAGEALATTKRLLELAPRYPALA